MSQVVRVSDALRLVVAASSFVLLSVLAAQGSTWASPNAQGTTGGTVPGTVPTPGSFYLPVILKNGPVTTPTPSPPSSFGFWLPAPNGMVSALNRLYVASRTQNNVAIWDENSQQIIKWVSVGSQPWGVTLANQRVFVANFASATVSVIDANTMNRLPDINLAATCAGGPANIAANPSTNRVYVAMYGSAGRVAVIDATTDGLIECLDTGKAGAFGVAVNPNLSQLYVTHRDGMNLQVWNISTTPATRIQSWDLAGVPYVVQSDLNNSQAYLTVAYDSPTFATPNHLDVLNPTGGLPPSLFSVIGNTDDGGAIWVSQATGNLYVAATADNQLWVINPTTLASQTIAMPDPYGITENVGLGRMYIGNRSAGWVNIQPDTISP